MLATVKNSALNAVFPICCSLIIGLPTLHSIIPGKTKQTNTTGGLTVVDWAEDMEFPGVATEKNGIWKFQESIKISGISRGVFKKKCGISMGHGSWLLSLVWKSFPQRGEASFCQEYPKLK